MAALRNSLLRSRASALPVLRPQVPATLRLLPRATRASSSSLAPSSIAWSRSSSSSSSSAPSTPALQAQAAPLEPESLAIEAPSTDSKPQSFAQIEPRLSLTFTCTHDECNHRSTHEFSKRAYTKGLVIVQCPECKARHLIADHIGWFKESTEQGTLKTVEDLLRAKGEKVRKGRIGADGDIEIDGE